jgi:osmotically-inducible protein OsmY
MNASGIVETACPNSEHLELLVQRRLGSRVRDLRVLVRQDGVILQGRAGTYHAKQLAQHAAMELTALPILANDIEVR